MSPLATHRIADVMHQNIMIAIQNSIGLHDHLAAQVAAEVMKTLQTYWGGTEIYIPALDPESRNQAIRAAFDGRNHAQVCAEFQISLRTLYRILCR